MLTERFQQMRIRTPEALLDQTLDEKQKHHNIFQRVSKARVDLFIHIQKTVCLGSSRAMEDRKEQRVRKQARE